MDSELKGWLWIAFVIALILAIICGTVAAVSIIGGQRRQECIKIMVASDNDFSAADIREACDKNYRR